MLQPPMHQVTCMSKNPLIPSLPPAAWLVTMLVLPIGWEGDSAVRSASILSALLWTGGAWWWQSPSSTRMVTVTRNHSLHLPEHQYSQLAFVPHFGHCCAFFAILHWLVPIVCSTGWACLQEIAYLPKLAAEQGGTGRESLIDFSFYYQLYSLSCKGTTSLLHLSVLLYCFCC